jgi:hypothetical protein
MGEDAVADGFLPAPDNWMLRNDHIRLVTPLASAPRRGQNAAPASRDLGSGIWDRMVNTPCCDET